MALLLLNLLSRTSPLSLLLAVLLIINQLSDGSEYNVDDSVLYSVNFGRNDETFAHLKQKGASYILLNKEATDFYKKASEEAIKSLKDDEGDDETKSSTTTTTVVMTTKHNEQYTCTLPQLKSEDSRREEVLTSNDSVPLDYLEPLFTSKSCAYSLEPYWSYELCHGNFLKQYHKEMNGKEEVKVEYILGRFDKEAYAIERALQREASLSGKLKKPPKKRIDNTNMPYLEIVMRDGTLCDLNGLPRMSRVRYVCQPSGKHEIFSVEETSTCEYEVIVLSPLLCNHLDYKPESANEHPINCLPYNDKAATKPLDLVKQETSSLQRLAADKMFQVNLIKDGSVKIQVIPVSGMIEEEDMEADVEERSSKWTSSHRESFKPLMDAEVVREFLKGEYCLFGGSGWWKYEFCYGKKVDQYHVEAKKRSEEEDEEGSVRRTVINLGKFDKQKHLEWLEANPNKRPKPLAFRKQISHFYSGGDHCEAASKDRQVEVKLKCKKADSPSTVSLYLLEPKVCEYIIGVESPLVCDILPLADENGLMESTHVIFDATSEDSVSNIVKDP